jgi:hypothetical protein
MMMSTSARVIAVLALASTGLTGLAAAAPAHAADGEQTMNWYSLSRVAHPGEPGWVSLSCPKAAMPYLTALTTSATLSDADASQYLDYELLSQSADGKSASMKFNNTQSTRTPPKDQVGIQVKLSVTCSNVKPPAPPKPRFSTQAVIPPASAKTVVLACPNNRPNITAISESHTDGLVFLGTKIVNSSAAGRWENLDGLVFGYGTLTLECD